ncbi:MAG: Hsp20/alpha crystallin family protein [Candidatus Taylorbacteria bacterium]|nr:Hsp20/alpha crystallin family protein [Candidatus Taylorbacteria bacterium]
MAKEKKSFFERITGTVRMDENQDIKDEKITTKGGAGWSEDEEKEGELTVDVYQTTDMIVIKSMIAGVRPEDLDISITRDMITIKGKREEEKIARDDDYFMRELYWGSFSRTITLPEEIDVDESEAIEKHGLLILKLPKLDKKRQSKLKVRMI